MTTREKIIVGVMCLSIAYGAYDLLGSGGGRAKAPPSQANPMDELKQFVMEISQKLAGDKPSEDYQYMITQAGDPWPKDPFLLSSALLRKSRAAQVTVSEPQPAERTPDFIYTGYMQIEGTLLAIVNGIEYAKGESLRVEDYYIKEIHPKRVVIGKINSRETIQLPIADVDSGN